MQKGLGVWDITRSGELWVPHRLWHIKASMWGPGFWAFEGSGFRVEGCLSFRLQGQGSSKP